MANIGKIELVKIASKKTDLSQANMKLAYECICETIREQVIEGNKVTLEGLGTFLPTVKEAHEARNPGTGQQCEVPARLMVKFSVNTNFKLALREVDVEQLAEVEEAPAKKKAPQPQAGKAKSGRR